MKHWYLIYSKPRREKVANANFERQGFRTYLPLVRRPRHRMGRRVMGIEPLFPRYLFIHLDTITDNWAPIRSTLGVTNLVRFGEEPAVVPEGLVELLMARDDASGIQELPLEEFRKGSRVRISEGLMMGYEGIFLAKTSYERVQILLDIVGTQARVSLNMSHLEAVN